MIRILLADDHTVVRQVVRQLLEREEDMTVVGEVSDGLQVPDAVEALQPDVVLLDLNLPGLHGLGVLRRMARRCPSARVLVLSGQEDELSALNVLLAGAAGYLGKSSPSAEIIGAVRDVAAGCRFISPLLAHDLVSAALAGQIASTDPYHALTDREREVFALVAGGASYAAIAGQLGIGVRTVESHRANAARKLGLRTSTDFVHAAIRYGLLPPE